MSQSEKKSDAELRRPLMCECGHVRADHYDHASGGQIATGDCSRCGCTRFRPGGPRHEQDETVNARSESAEERVGRAKVLATEILEAIRPDTEAKKPGHYLPPWLRRKLHEIRDL